MRRADTSGRRAVVAFFEDRHRGHQVAVDGLVLHCARCGARADIDLPVILRAVAGRERVSLARHERHAAAVWLFAAGYGTATAAARLGLVPRTVERYRMAWRVREGAAAVVDAELGVAA